MVQGHSSPVSRPKSWRMRLPNPPPAKLKHPPVKTSPGHDFGPQQLVYRASYSMFNCASRHALRVLIGGNTCKLDVGRWG
jgi:hypothetical protein